VNRLQRNEQELLPSLEEPIAAIYAHPMRVRLDKLWHGTVGRVFRFTCVFIVVFFFIVMVLMAIEKYNK
jgi:hypothetical protein